MKTNAIILSILLFVMQPVNAEFSGIFEIEWGIDKKSHGQKIDVEFSPEWNFELSDNTQMTFIARARWSGLNSLGSITTRPDNYSDANGAIIYESDGELSIREWYLDTEALGAFWRIGKQQVVWGQADGLKVLDVVNPQSFREFILDDFEDSRIPLWMINVEIPIGEEGSLQLIWIPDNTYNEFAQDDSDYEITSPLFVPQLTNGLNVTAFNQIKPSSIVNDSDIGLRYSVLKSGWDLTLNYFYHYIDSPILYQNIEKNGVVIDSIYKRNQLIGATASNAFGDFTIRAEVGYNADTYSLSTDLTQRGIHKTSELSSVFGLDWQGLENTMISGQWFQSYLFDYDPNVIRPQSNNILSLLYKRSFQNDAWDIELLDLYGLDRNDSVIQLTVNYFFQSNIKLNAGIEIFHGNKQGLFGQFRDNDRLVFGIQWGL